MIKADDFEFEPPPEAPVFEPTDEEFADPLAYISKIRPVVEQTGICKIRPPPYWQPPFAVDVEKFRFTPRIQKLNELEAQTRSKLNFLDKLAKFWDLQGVRLRVPNVERKSLDLFKLHKFVQEEGGYENVCRDKKWTRITQRLHFPQGRHVNSTIRAHYERILYPFDIFEIGATLDPTDLEKFGPKSAKNSPLKLKREDNPLDKDDKDYQPHIRNSVDSPKKEGERKSKRFIKEEDIDYSANPELRKLQFLGPGPKAAVPFNPDLKDEEGNRLEGSSLEEAIEQACTRKAKPKSHSLVDGIMCHTCHRGDAEEMMLLCDNCDDAFHIFCLIPPLPDVPKGDWRCPRCVAMECNKPMNPYGFEQAKREYTLQDFGEMADDFKASYFNMPGHMVPYSVAEREFWRLTQSIDEDIAVEYGADIHAKDQGSGFPVKRNQHFFDDDVTEYVESKWNLNNLPMEEPSVLGQISADISGMKIPWCYVGMCFSSFCWHNEDHWSYSINYLHWGEPKTWYGVPGSMAEKFEEAMRSTTPELFETSPDLLHHITTIMNPNTLMKHGVPIVRTDQCAGEFIVTFPRAYHAGFNQGYNFAEAVNFCPPDWLPIGRECIEHYRSMHRQCVFSHEELICQMAADPERLSLTVAASVYDDMVLMVDREKKLRKALMDMGVTEAEREAFELLPDDERQCDHCKTTCFLSAVTCPCSPSRIVCVDDCENLCRCKPSRHVLRYRYTLDELPAMMNRLKLRAESFDQWAVKVNKSITAAGDERSTLCELKELVQEAEDKSFPESELMTTLKSHIQDADKCAHLAGQLVSRKVRTRHRQCNEGKQVAKLTLDELESFIEQVDSLPCIIKEAALIKALLQKVVDFQVDARAALNDEVPESAKVEKLMEFGVTLDVDLPEIPRLRDVLQQARWLDDVRNTLAHPSTVTLETMRKMLDGGVNLAPHTAVEKAMAELQELLTISERWEERARICLQARPRHVIATLEAIINEARGIPANLPNVEQLKESLRRAKEWTAKVEGVQVPLQNGEHYPYLDVLETLVNKGRPIPVRLDQLPQVESQVAAAKSWRERTARTFLKKNSTYTLVEVLSPRNDIGMYSLSSRMKKSRKLRDGERERGTNEFLIMFEGKSDEHRDPVQMVNAFKQAENSEIECMRELRMRNMEKHTLQDEFNEEVKFCVCRRGASGFMLQCELCRDWFHNTCVPLPKSANMKTNKNSHQAIMQAARDLKFLCPQCLRSRRPRLETILSLLVSLQKLPVRLPEGEALQCLTERAMAWQDRARQALATDELASALAKLSVLSQKIVEQAAREKTEKIITAELLKAANNPELQSHLPNVPSFNNGSEELGVSELTSGSGIDMDDTNIPVVAADIVVNDFEQEVEIGGPGGPLSCSMSNEHAYSTAHKNPAAMSSPRKPRKSPLVPRQVETPVLELSDLAKAQLEELMMEGDLLEVSLDETQHIWRILQACQARTDDRVMEFEHIDPDLMSLKLERSFERKKYKRRMALGLGEESEDKTKKKKFKWSKEARERLKERKEKAKKLLQVTLGTVIESKLSKEEKKKRKKLLKEKLKLGVAEEKKKKIRAKSSKKVALDLDEKDEDDCDATKCLKPLGNQVNWVQCDSCELWFHLTCVGLSQAELDEIEDYICFKCRHKKSAPVQPDPFALSIKTETFEPRSYGSYGKPKDVRSLDFRSLAKQKPTMADLERALNERLPPLSEPGQTRDEEEHVDILTPPSAPPTMTSSETSQTSVMSVDGPPSLFPEDAI